MSRPLRVMMVAAECAPFAKAGGLADVVGALPRALATLGVDVRVVMPLYAGLPWDHFELLDGTVIVPLGDGPRFGAVRLGLLPRSAVPVYFLEHHGFYDRAGIYGPPGGAWHDNLERFTFLSRGALALSEALGWIPDVVHANDWHTALVPMYLRTGVAGEAFARTASVFAVHNLEHQGVFDPAALPLTGLGWEHWRADALEHFGALNLMKGALLNADRVVAVSPTYAREIQTPVHGCGLDGVLRARADGVVGILNGIDVTEWDPAADPHCAAPYDAGHRDGKAACKAALQREAGLPERPEVPVFGVVGRLVRQKGTDVVVAALERLLGWDLQIVVLGTGDHDLADAWRAAAARWPSRCAAWIQFDEGRAHRIEAGADFFLMPSRFEPCGLNQLYSLRYGTLPIVRATGGLVDTVAPYDPVSGDGTGFVFQDLTVEAVVGTIGWALETWRDRPHHIEGMRQRAMTQDYSWGRAAAAYVQLYRDAQVNRPIG